MPSETQEPTRPTPESPATSSPPEPYHLYQFEKGTLITERYEVVESLGFGGFSEVYHCKDKKLGRQVAVKILIKGKDKGLELAEARAAALLKHPHIVQVYDVEEPGNEGENPVVVFDYIKGRTLEERLDEAQYRRLSLDDEAIRIIHQVSQALDYAHSEGVIHRDVKPSNIILDEKENAYLTDFGLAAIKLEEQHSMLSSEIQRQLSGTIPYMAPELLREESVSADERSDLYSLGVVVYEMLTGQFPYRGKTTGLVYQIATSAPIPPTMANPELPKGIEPVLMRALDKEPDKRYTSCSAFAKEFEDAAKAYVEAAGKYEQAQKLFESNQWRQALAAFETLQEHAPGFSDTAHYLEQSRHQVQLLKLYEQAQELIQSKKYEEALDNLNALDKVAAEYNVDDLREQALNGLATQQRHTLDQQYQKAVQQFEEGEYQACLDTLAVIRKQDPDYPISAEIEEPAREEVKRQQKINELRALGVEQMNQEQWEKAIETFKKLKDQAPSQEVETQLAMARHMDRMSSLFYEARDLFSQEQFADSVDKINELRQIDADYRKVDVTQIHERALERLYKRVIRLLEEGKFEEGLQTLKVLEARSPNYPNIEELRKQAQDGIQSRNLKRELDALYQKAKTHINDRQYQEALQVWQSIQQQKGELDYPDEGDVEKRAREGIGGSYYAKALTALSQRQPKQALDLWKKVQEIDPSYLDSQQLKRQAEEMIEHQHRSRKLLRGGILLGGGVITILLLIFLASGVIRNWIFPSQSTPTATETSARPVTPSKTIISVTPTIHLTISSTPDEHSPTPTMPTSTPSATPTPSPTSKVTVTTLTPSPTPTAILTPSPTITTTPSADVGGGTIAVANQGAGIFAAPDADLDIEGSISKGEEVTVLGRSAYGQWYYIRDAQGVEGFVYAPRFDWSGDFDSLLVISSSSFTPAPSPVPDTECQPGPLELDAWPVNKFCTGGGWTATIFVQGHGGDCIYTYYWERELKAGPMSGSTTFDVSGVGHTSSIVGEVSVTSAGESAVEGLLISPPNCGN